MRLSADGEAVVFHDETLEQTTGHASALESLTAAELSAVRLAGSHEPIPTLERTLAQVAGRSLLLVEIKSGPDVAAALAERTGQLLARYDGPAAAISFDARALAVVKASRPDIPRG